MATKETGPQGNADKTKYMVISGDQNAGRSNGMKNDCSSFARVEEFKYFGTALTNLNSIQEEIKSRFKSGNACCLSLRNLLSSSWLSKYLKININRTIILPVVLYGSETWSPALREEHRIGMFEIKVLRMILGHQTEEVNSSGDNFEMTVMI